MQTNEVTSRLMSTNQLHMKMITKSLMDSCIARAVKHFSMVFRAIGGSTQLDRTKVGTVVIVFLPGQTMRLELWNYTCGLVKPHLSIRT